MTRIPRDDIEDVIEISKKICVAIHPFVDIKNYMVTLPAFTDAFARVIGTIILKEDIESFTESFKEMLHQMVKYKEGLEK